MYEFHWQSNDCVSNKYITEPVRLIGEGNYNLNVLKEIDVTDSYLGLDQEVRVKMRNHRTTVEQGYVGTLF